MPINLFSLRGTSDTKSACAPEHLHKEGWLAGLGRVVIGENGGAAASFLLKLLYLQCFWKGKYKALSIPPPPQVFYYCKSCKAIFCQWLYSSVHFSEILILHMGV